MSYRKHSLETNYIYHIMSRSIAKFNIFNDDTDYKNFIERMSYYQRPIPGIKFSKLDHYSQNYIHKLSNEQIQLVDIICYCIMPTHIHLVLYQKVNYGISNYLKLLLNSYTRYFNIKHRRKGPLWETTFKNIKVATDEQLLHLTRYVHLNPCSVGIVNRPKDWEYSSYNEYIEKSINNMCKYSNHLSINSKLYDSFCHERIDEQRELSIIKSQIIENYSG